MMTSDSVGASSLSVRQTRLVRVQRATIGVLLASLVAALAAARWEHNRAAQWRRWAIEAQAARNAEPGLPTNDPPFTAHENKPERGYYGVTLIAEDGSKTPLTGKTLQIDMGDKRLLEIYLEQQKNNYLLMWAPARRNDNYFHQFIYRPGCANVTMLELLRHDLKEGEPEVVSYEAPKP